MKYLKSFKIFEHQSNDLESLIGFVKTGNLDLAIQEATSKGLLSELESALELRYRELIKLAEIDTDRSIFSQINYLHSLDELDFVDRQLSELPESIGDLQNLEDLYLAYNKLSELPESIGNLQSLESLILANNDLSKLPESIGNLQSLQILFLDNNNLNELPDSIGNLQSLERLDLYDNNFSKLQIQELKQKLPNCRIN